MKKIVLLCFLILAQHFSSSAQVAPLFPQARINRALQFSQKQSSEKRQNKPVSNPSPTTSFRKLFELKNTYPSSIAAAPISTTALSKTALIDTLAVGEVPNDTLIITGNWTHAGPIYVYNDGVLIFKNANATNVGDVYVFGHGKLFADSSTLIFPQQFFYERSLLVVQHGYARMQNCSLNYSGYSHNLFLADSGKAEFKNIHQNDFTTCGMFGSPSISIDGCNIAGEYILNDKSTSIFKNVDTLLLWHQIPDSALINFSFPSGDTVSSYLFNNTLPGINGIDYSVQVDSSRTVWWALMPVNGSDVTLSNSKVRAIGAWFMRGDNVSVTGVYDNSTYSNYVMPVTDRNLHLINCTVQTWSFYAFDSSHVDITACQLGEVGCQSRSSIFSSQFILDGSGGYFWATDTSFILANDVDVYSTVRSEKNGIFVLAYSWLPFLPPMAIGNGLMVCVQSKLAQNPVAYNNGVTWLSFIDAPDTAYTNSTIPVNGSVWIDQGPAGGWMNFDSYSLYYKSAGDSAWSPIVLNVPSEVHQGLLSNWNTNTLVPGFYAFRLISYNNLGDSIEAFKTVRVLQSTVGITEFNTAFFSAKVHPNPTSGDFQFEVHSDKFQELQLIVKNAQGKIVFQQLETISKGKTNFPVQIKLAPGIYFYSAKSNSGSSSGRLIIH
ncbi:MAG: T9SS type A sorting domain-containing protein [Bacteroidetes bacterium]|nr:T9SS type A sorting domain-containing protein [Bacteroidota bacterium]